MVQPFAVPSAAIKMLLRLDFCVDNESQGPRRGMALIGN